MFAVEVVVVVFWVGWFPPLSSLPPLRVGFCGRVKALFACMGCVGVVCLGFSNGVVAWVVVFLCLGFSNGVFFRWFVGFMRFVWVFLRGFCLCWCVLLRVFLVFVHVRWLVVLCFVVFACVLVLWGVGRGVGVLVVWRGGGLVVFFLVGGF